MTLSPRQIDQFTQRVTWPSKKRSTEAISRRDPRSTEEKITAAPGSYMPPGNSRSLYAERAVRRRLACICRETMELYPEMDIMLHRGKAAFDFLRNDRLLDLVESFVGPEITCSPIQHIRAKLPAALTPDSRERRYPRGALASGCRSDVGRSRSALHPHGLGAAGGRDTGKWLHGDSPGMVGAGLLPHHTKAGAGTTIIPDSLPDDRTGPAPHQERRRDLHAQGDPPPLHAQPDRHRPLEHGPPLPEDRHADRSALPPRVRRPQPRQPRLGPYLPCRMCRCGGRPGKREGAGFLCTVGEGGIEDPRRLADTTKSGRHPDASEFGRPGQMRSPRRGDFHGSGIRLAAVFLVILSTPLSRESPRERAGSGIQSVSRRRSRARQITLLYQRNGNELGVNAWIGLL